MTRPWAIGLLLAGIVGCGIQGPPVPPETIGINPKLQRDKERQAKEQAALKAKEPPAAAGSPDAQQQSGDSDPGPMPPLDGSIQPSARPGGDVQLKPR